MTQPLGPGSEIDGFRLGELLHTGSMATIYRLAGPDGPLPLIIKIPRLGAAERAINVIAFEVCRMVLGALAQSPHHPTLVAFGDVETVPYLVMEYVEGTRLDDRVPHAPLSPEEIARLGAALALGLHEIHRQGALHLDLKPTTVLYRPSGEAVLIDFGLARHGHYPDLLEEEFRTPIGNWVYLAPEQIVGVRCDPRSDIFALGAILYHLATGRFPFGKPSRMAELRRRLYRDPLPPRAIVPETPGWLQEIILHCLEVDARERYASAAAVAFDLANPAQVAITERGLRDRRTGATTLFRRWLQASKFKPAPCPPVSAPSQPAPIVLVAIPPGPPNESAFAALRDAARRVTTADRVCRVACVTVVPSAAGLSGERYEETPTGRHIAQLVNLRRFARPLELPEERLTYHVLESDKPAAALIDYAKMNEVDQILLGAPRSGRPMRLATGVAAQVVAEAQCTVSVVRPRPQQ